MNRKKHTKRKADERFSLQPIIPRVPPGTSSRPGPSKPKNRRKSRKRR